jgi:hypothetical protein
MISSSQFFDHMILYAIGAFSNPVSCNAGIVHTHSAQKIVVTAAGAALPVSQVLDAQVAYLTAEATHGG